MSENDFRVSGRTRRVLLRIAQVSATFLLFVGFNHLGSWFQIEKGVSVFFPATAVDVISCVYFGWAGALGVFLGGLATPWQPGETLSQTSISALLNVAEGMIPWLMFRLRRDLHRDLHDLRSLIAFILFGTILNSAVSATFGNLLLVAPTGSIDHDAWFMWWVSDFSAAVLLATPILAFGGPWFENRRRGRQPTAATRTLSNAVQVTLVIIFLGWSSSTAIQNYLSGRIEQDRIAEQQHQSRASKLLTELEAEILASRHVEPTAETTPQVSRSAAETRLILSELGMVMQDLPLSAQALLTDVRSASAEFFQASARRREAAVEPLRASILRLRSRIEEAEASAWTRYGERHERIMFVSLLMDQMVLLVLILAGVHLISRVTAPLRQIDAQVRNLERGAPFDPEQIDSSLVEIDSLVRALEETTRSLREREEDLRLQTRAALAASRAKSEFLAKMSHELRTPLNSIIGFSDLLREGGTLRPERRDLFLGNISEGGHKLLRMINDLLDIAKVESGKMTFDFVDVDLRLLIDSTVRSITSVLERRNQRVLTEITSDPLPVHVDVGRMEQVFLNLLSNASKFSPEGSTIRISVAARGTECEIRFADSGVGIASEDLDRIFGEFEQSRTTGPTTEGTGLGLALVQHFVRVHGGRISVESRIGEGSTFRIILPLRASSPDHGHPSPSTTRRS